MAFREALQSRLRSSLAVVIVRMLMESVEKGGRVSRVIGVGGSVKQRRKTSSKRRETIHDPQRFEKPEYDVKIVSQTFAVWSE